MRTELYSIGSGVALVAGVRRIGQTDGLTPQTSV